MGYDVCSKWPQNKIYLESEQEKRKEFKKRLCQETEE